MLPIFKVIRQRSRLFYFFVILLGILTSASHFCIIYIINQAITFKALPFFQEYNWLVFAVVLIVSFFSTMFFQRYLIGLVNDIGFEYNVKIFEAIRNTS